MVTSNKLPERKIMKMSGHNSVAVVPQRTLLGEVNEHIMCPLCRGYYIDATTIVECLHSFCRSCIIKHLQAKSYCPVCEMMINSAKPNIKLDKALQDIVYKLVPGLFQREMERRQQFYASRPGPAASATPEQRGEDTERIIFSPEDVISFSLEYADATDTDSISSKSSDSNEPQPAVTRRYLQCPAVVNISHLKKFLSMKFDIDSTQFAIDILYKRVPLPDYYTLMDIAYIYNWKRNEPMRFFYQIIDYVAIRNRFFDINRKGSHFRDRKSSPTSTEDTNVSSPAQNLNDHGSDGSSGADSPMPGEKSHKQSSDITKKCDNKVQTSNKDQVSTHDTQFNKSANVTTSKKNDDEVEKSQFLNSFELTAKNSNTPTKLSPTKLPNTENITHTSKAQTEPKTEETLKRKNQTQAQNAPEIKKLKLELEKTKVPLPINSSASASLQQNVKICETKAKNEGIMKTNQSPPANSSMNHPALPPKETKAQQVANVKQQSSESPIKRVVPGTQNVSSPKRKPANETISTQSSLPTQTKKMVSPLKLQIPKIESQSPNSRVTDVQKVPSKKMPDLKPSTLSTNTSQNKGQPVNKVRMDLLANNSDPTIDRSKILSQVKTSLSSQNNGQQSGDPLKSIFDSCNINIPSSLSITLTDQKLDSRNQSEVVPVDQKKNILNKNLVGVSNNPSHKIPSPPVHNYIEILKLPDTDSKKPNKSESNVDGKSNPASKSDTNTTHNKSVNKSSETSAKGPIPNLKPISDTKLGKQTGNFSSPITFQQTFEQQLQSMQTEKKPKLPKAKTQVPKLVPAPKVFNVVSKSVSHGNKPISSNISGTEPKSSSALDLSTPHNIPSQAGGQQTFDKALETMQSIANLAKKQNLPSKGLPLAISQSSTFSGITNRPVSSGASPLRLPPANNTNQIKVDKPTVSHSNTSRQDASKNVSLKQTNNLGSSVLSPSYPISAQHSSSTPQPSPRSQTRSPSSSPKLVIAEDKQANSSLEQNLNQSNLAMSHNPNVTKNDSPKASPGPSKPGLKPMKTLPSAVKVAGIRQPMALNSTMTTPPDYMSRPQLVSTPHHLLRQMDINAWLKIQRQFDLIKSMSNMAHETQNDFNNKDKQ